MSGNLKGSGGDIAPFSESFLPWKKSVSAVFIAGTHIICPTAGYILAVNVCGDETGPGTAAFHDGHNVTGRMVWHEQALGNHAHGGTFEYPIYCDTGITLIAAACDYVSVQWLPGPRLK